MTQKILRACSRVSTASLSTNASASSTHLTHTPFVLDGYRHPLFVCQLPGAGNWLSLLPSPLKSLKSREIPLEIAYLGALPEGVTKGPFSPASLSPFALAQDWMHYVFTHTIHQDPTLQALALHQKLGYLNVNDSRSGAAFGRVADPEDILGNVRLDNGKIVPGSYERMPTHRVLSGTSGLMELSDFQHDSLLKSFNNSRLLEDFLNSQPRD